MKVNIKYLSLALLIFCTVGAHAQKQVTVAFWNVENLYDTKNDSTIDDEEFLPEAKNQWTEERYKTKLARLTEIISGMGEKGPDFLGVAEIENRKVLTDLAASLEPVTGPYQIVHYNSPDRRGIDVGFFYKPEFYTVVSSHNFPIHMPDDTAFRTRDILMVRVIKKAAKKDKAKAKQKTAKGKMSADVAAARFGQDTITFFVCHWPSRRGGEKESEPKRVFVANEVRKQADKLLAVNPDSKIIIMGDLNDEPNNISVTQSLKAVSSPDSLAPGRFFDIMGPLKAQGQGSYYFKGEFNMIDNIILSDGLLKSGPGLKYVTNSSAIYKTEKSQEASGKYAGSPLRTYVGPNYKGGYSDHFPVYFRMK
ncbi:MAG: endonuclease/exonuclease/phosphatase family protein [Bacteroidota bacterium]